MHAVFTALPSRRDSGRPRLHAHRGCNRVYRLRVVHSGLPGGLHQLANATRKRRRLFPPNLHPIAAAASIAANALRSAHETCCLTNYSSWPKGTLGRLPPILDCKPASNAVCAIAPAPARSIWPASSLKRNVLKHTGARTLNTRPI